MVPPSVPAEPAEIAAQVSELTALHDMVPVPVFATENVAEPEADGTALSAGVIERIGCPAACVNVTESGLPVAPSAVTVIVATRWLLVGFAAYATVMVPAFEPAFPPVIVAHESPLAAVQVISPVPLLVTENVALPAVAVTALSDGVTERTGWPAACVNVTVAGLPVAPTAVTVSVATR